MKSKMSIRMPICLNSFASKFRPITKRRRISKDWNNRKNTKSASKKGRDRPFEPESSSCDVNPNDHRHHNAPHRHNAQHNAQHNAPHRHNAPHHQDRHRPMWCTIRVNSRKATPTWLFLTTGHIVGAYSKNGTRNETVAFLKRNPTAKGCSSHVWTSSVTSEQMVYTHRIHHQDPRSLTDNNDPIAHTHNIHLQDPRSLTDHAPKTHTDQSTHTDHRHPNSQSRSTTLVNSRKAGRTRWFLTTDPRA